MVPRASALMPSYEPDTYLCTWQVPDQLGDFVDLPGDLKVLASRAPSGSLYGGMPLSWTHTAAGSSSASFPQVVEVPALRGQLANGGMVLLLDARVEDWLPNTGYVSGSAALLGKGSAFFGSRALRTAVGSDARSGVLFSEAEFQFSALDALLGSTPIAKISHPSVGLTNPMNEWTAHVNLDADGDWSSDGYRLEVEYRGRGPAMSGYSFQLGFSPLARLTLDTPVALRALVEEFVVPLKKIASVATGKPGVLTYLAVSEVDAGSATMLQVFGSGITQEPYESSPDLREKVGCALRAKPDGVSLLDVLLRWRQLELDHHPLAETYGAMLHASDQHPRSRLLLLLQSLEGMHGYDTKSAYERRSAKHRERRTAVLASAEQALPPDDLRFLKRSLPKWPATSLESVIDTTVCGLPVNTMDKLAGTELVRRVIADDETVSTPGGALRVIRNGLAHGSKGYDAVQLNEVVAVLERVVRAHALRLLGCPDIVLSRVLEDE